MTVVVDAADDVAFAAIASQALAMAESTADTIDAIVGVAEGSVGTAERAAAAFGDRLGPRDDDDEGAVAAVPGAAEGVVRSVVDGRTDGDAVGSVEGVLDGRLDGCVDGCVEGRPLGHDDGGRVGVVVVGRLDGCVDG